MEKLIKCPHCGGSLDVEQALYGKVESSLREEYEKKVQEQAKRFSDLRENLEKEKQDFEEKKQHENEIFRKRLEMARLEERQKIENQLKEKSQEEMELLKKKLTEKDEENRSLRRKELELLQKEKDLENAKEEIQMAMQKEFLEKQREIEIKAREKERENFSLKEKEYQKQIEDTKKLAEEMKRKSEQGSMQLQGEVQELALEELLISMYPFDQIEEVSKGIRGADTLQHVMNQQQISCGTIVYESKRTKNFSNDWIDKLKQDQVNCKADLAVLVTETMPSEMQRFGEKNGVWICSFIEVKSVSFVLREMLIRMQQIKKSQENRGDKMELLYTYFTSNEFSQNIQRIVENYDGMIQQLNKEKRAMYKIWKEREKHIWAVQENLSSVFGSIKGIAGNELSAAKFLELPSSEIED